MNKYLKNELDQSPMGRCNEEKFLPFLNDYYSKYGKIVKTGGKNDVLDFKSEDGLLYIEMKSRCNYYNTYPTTIFGANKMKECFDNTHLKYIFVFIFIDGMYEWEFSLENYKLAGGSKSIVVGQDKDKTSKTNFNIPIEQLKKISNEGCIVPTNMKDRVPLPTGTCLIKLKKSY
jgi:hypothetical protein